MLAISIAIALLGQVQDRHCACFTVQTWSQLQWYMPVIPVLERPRQEDHEFQACLDDIVRLRKQKEGARDVTQVVECLPSAHEA